MKKAILEPKKINYTIIIISILFIVFTILNLLLLSKDKKVTNYIVDENIVFFGDSITEGYNIKEFFPDNYVINSGIGGNEAEHLLNRIERDVYLYNPSKIFILIGINDLNSGISKKDILANIQKIINGIKINRKYTHIYIQSIYPLNKVFMSEKNYPFNKDITNETIKDVNSELEKMCVENSINYVNVYDSLLDEQGNLKSSYTKEGLHLNDLGYFKVTKALEKYIN